MSSKCRSPSMEGANSAQPNPLAGFYKPLRGGGKREEKGRKGGERNGGKGGKGQDVLYVCLSSLSVSLLCVCFVWAMLPDLNKCMYVCMYVQCVSKKKHPRHF